MLALHPNARTTPAVRAEIARSREPTSVLAQRDGVSTETLRKCGLEACQDRCSRPHKLPCKATDEERAWVWSTGRRGPTRRKPMGVPSASTGGFRARCWGSRSTATRTLSSCCTASIRPTMPVVSVC